MVHGGASLVEHCVVDSRVEAAIESLVPLAPLHNPATLHWIRQLRDAFGSDILQVAIFDTAFYATLPDVAARYALPDIGGGEPIRRYGFHGLAHEAMYTAWRGQVQPETGARTISLQLGAGCSVTAAINGKPVETSMGFTPMEGLVMATRSGDVDPGLLLYLLRERGLTIADLDRLLNRESGLLGMSGISGDMRTLLACSDRAANLAVDVYCHRIRKYIGAYLGVLGGADAILFGGGVGENSALIRERVLSGFEFAGVKLSDNRNTAAVGPMAAIHAADSKVKVWVAAVDEARHMAQVAVDIVTPLQANTGHPVEGCFDGVTGWSIGALDSDPATHGASLYNRLEQDVLPIYHAGTDGWAKIMLATITRNATQFSSHSMMRRYATEAYLA